MPEIWDVEDPANAEETPLCNLFVKESKPDFTTMFQNSGYKVLEVIKEWLLHELLPSETTSVMVLMFC